MIHVLKYWVTEFYIPCLFGGSEDKYRYNLKVGKGRSQDLNVRQVFQLLLCTTTMLEHGRVYILNVEHMCLVSWFEHVIVRSEFLISLYMQLKSN